MYLFYIIKLINIFLNINLTSKQVKEESLISSVFNLSAPFFDKPPTRFLLNLV